MKKILLILVGGTICTALNEHGNLAVDEKAGVLLKENYLNSDSLFAKSVEIVTSKNLYILSENMTVSRWNQILDTFREYMKKDTYDGVVIAHGTDTLAYSAALFSMLFCGIGVPVFLVSAHRSLLSEGTNGNDNFKYAVECICYGITPNVYVTYKNPSDEKMYLHLASRLRQCENYSDDFHSVGAMDITELTEENRDCYFEKLERMYPRKQQKPVLDVFGSWHLRECVLMVQPYVGLNYAAFKYDQFLAVLHGTFHSGTACAEQSERNKDYGENSILYMLDRCAEQEPPVDVYFSPSILKKGTYETISIIGTHEVRGKRAKFLYGYTNEMAYAKLLIAYSVFQDEKDRQEFIYNEYNFERIDRNVSYEE